MSDFDNVHQFRAKPEEAPRTPVPITRIINLKGNLSKTFTWRPETKTLDVEASGDLYQGVASVKTVDSLQGLKRELETIWAAKTHSIAYALGVPKNGESECVVLTKTDLDKVGRSFGAARVAAREAGYHEAADGHPIARTKEHMVFRHQKTFMLLDYDFKPECYTPETRKRAEEANDLVNEYGLVRAIARMSGMDFLRDVGYLEVPSSSNGIVMPGGEVKRSNGRHAYVVVDNGTNIPKVINNIFTQLFAHEYGWLHLASNGRVLRRSALDVTVGSPERLVYESLPVLVGNLSQPPKVATLVPGDVIESDRVRGSRRGYESYVERIISDSGRQEYTQGDSLNFDWPIELKDGKTTSVGELYKNGKDFGEFYDPIEGKSYGHATARYYHKNGSNSIIFSHAHGGVVYELAIPRQERSRGVSGDGADNNLLLECTKELLEASEYTVKYNKFARFIEVHNGKEKDTFDRVFAHNIKLRLIDLEEENLVVPSTSDVMLAIQSVIKKHFSYHPILSYFQLLKWDGVSRIDTWLSNALGVEHTEYMKEVGRLIILAAVKRVMEPGVKFDYLPVFVGGQGVGKSRAVQALAPEGRWFLDDIQMSADSKKVMEQTRGRWIVEIAELSGYTKKDMDHIKHFITRQEEVTREAYGHDTEAFPRSFIMIATTNDEEFLRDTTGNRRFLPVTVGKVDVQWIVDWRDQLYAEALDRLDEPLYIPEGMLEALDEAEEARQERFHGGPYYQDIKESLPEGALEGSRITYQELYRLVGVEQIKDVTYTVQSLVKQAMTALGYEYKKLNLGNGVRDRQFYINPKNIVMKELKELEVMSGGDVKALRFKKS